MESLLQEDAGRPAKRIFSQFSLSLSLFPSLVRLTIRLARMISRDSRIYWAGSGID